MFSKGNTMRFAALVAVLFLVGCAGAYYDNLPPELVPLAKYDEAISSFVAVKASFTAAVKAELDPALRKQMLDIGYPMFQRTDAALSAWGLYVKGGQDPTSKIQAYQVIWRELIDALLQMGIVEVK